MLRRARIWLISQDVSKHSCCFPTADSTGTHSLYTSYKDYEIMFHVSTLLPYTPNNKQQVGWEDIDLKENTQTLKLTADFN